MIPHSVSGMSLTFFAKGRMWSVSADHPRYEAIKEKLALSAKEPVSEDEVIALYDDRFAMVSASAGRLSFVGDQLTFDGTPLDNRWVRLIKDMREANEPFDPVFKALASLVAVDDQRLRGRIIDFVRRQRLGFLPDGRIASLVVVRSDYADVSGKAYVSPVGGAVARGESGPLLVGATGYQREEHTDDKTIDVYDFRPMAPERKVILVAVWPHDVTAQHGDKLSVAGYEVLDELDPTAVEAFVKDNGRVVRGYIQEQKPETADAAASEVPTANRVATGAVQRFSARARRSRQAA